MRGVKPLVERDESVRIPIRRSPSLVSVVIPALNASKTLPDQLAALENQDYGGEWELVIADNGSGDDTIARALRWQDRFARLIVVDASARPGAGYARNAGAMQAGGDLLAFCDADDLVDSQWLRQLVDRATSADIVGGSVSGAPDLPRIMGFLPHACGCSMAIWRNVFDELEGFDTRYLAGQDAELSWRAQLRGFTLHFAPDARVARRPRRHIRSVARQFYRYGYWGALLYKEYRAHGLPVTSPTKLIFGVAWLMIRLPYLMGSRKRRRIWIRAAAYKAGAIVGNMRHRPLNVP